MTPPPNTPLILKRLDWGDGTPPTDDDWTVWFGDERVGRIFYDPIGNSAVTWMWTITAHVKGVALTNGHGHCVDFGAAKAAFRKRWDEAGMAERVRHYRSVT